MLQQGSLAEPDHMFLGLLDPDPDPDPLVRGMDLDPDPNPSITKQNSKKTLIPTAL
jgi:hypothetical protein